MASRITSGPTPSPARRTILRAIEAAMRRTRLKVCPTARGKSKPRRVPLTGGDYLIDLAWSSFFNFGTSPPASRISSTFGGSGVNFSVAPDGTRTPPPARSSSITAPAVTPSRRPAHSITGNPRLIAFRKKMRSEEHTSELQSRLHLVCRLLLEKKKKKDTERPCTQTRQECI